MQSPQLTSNGPDTSTYTQNMLKTSRPIQRLLHPFSPMFEHIAPSLQDAGTIGLGMALATGTDIRDAWNFLTNIAPSLQDTANLGHKGCKALTQLWIVCVIAFYFLR